MRGSDLEVSLQQTKRKSQSQLDAQCHLWISDMKCIVRNDAFDPRECLPLQTGCSLEEHTWRGARRCSGKFVFQGDDGALQSEY